MGLTIVRRQSWIFITPWRSRMSKAHRVGRNTGRSEPSICLQGPGRRAGGWAAVTSGDLRFSQVWLQLTAVRHQESHDVGFPGRSGRTTGRSISVPSWFRRLSPWNESKMLLKYIQTLLISSGATSTGGCGRGSHALTPSLPLIPDLGLGASLLHVGTAQPHG